MFNQKILDGLYESADHPRIALYEARWNLVKIDEIPTWFLNHGSDNHYIQFLAACVLSGHTSNWSTHIIDVLMKLLKTHNIREQGSMYDTYYLASVCVFDHCAKRDGFGSIRSLCQRYYQQCTDLWSHLRDHRKKIIIPGCRTNPEGTDERRDQCLRFLLGEEPIRWGNNKWSRHYNMEVGLIKEWSEIENWSFKPNRSRTKIGLLSPITICEVEKEKGFIAISEKLFNCYGYPTWVVWSIKRIIGTKQGSISWKDMTNKLNSKRAKFMGSARKHLYIEDFVDSWKALLPKESIDVITTLT